MRLSGLGHPANLTWLDMQELPKGAPLTAELRLGRLAELFEPKMACPKAPPLAAVFSAGMLWCREPARLAIGSRASQTQLRRFLDIG